LKYNGGEMILKSEMDQEAAIVSMKNSDVEMSTSTKASSAN